MKEEIVMFHSILNRGQAGVQRVLHRVGQVISRWTKPNSSALALGAMADLARSKPQLVAENLLLRQSGRREDITIPHPPKNRTCDFHRIRLKHVLTHQFLSSVRSAIAFPRGFVGGSTGVR